MTAAHVETTEISDRGDCPFLPAAFSRRVTKFFERYSIRKIRRSFHTVHVDPTSIQTIEKIQQQTQPSIILMNHPSWWDPLTIMLIAGLYLRNRVHCAPMDIVQLRRYRIFRKIGAFGIDPEHPQTPAKMNTYIEEVVAQHPNALLWITPQGQFTDVRDAVNLRPGAAALAAKHTKASVFCVGVEYNYWQDQKAELFLRFQTCNTDDRSTSGWFRAMRQAMSENLDTLSQLVIKRDPSNFLQPLGSGRSRTSRVYDLMLRLRGQEGEIQTRPSSQKRSKK